MSHRHTWTFWERPGLILRFCKPCDVVEQWAKRKGWQRSDVPFSKMAIQSGKEAS